MIADLFSDFEAVAFDQEATVLILTSADTAFCAGCDVQEMVDHKGMFEGSANDIDHNYRNQIQLMVKFLYDLFILTIAAVNEPEIGTGCDFATFSDLRIGSKHPLFAESFVHAT